MKLRVILLPILASAFFVGCVDRIPSSVKDRYLTTDVETVSASSDASAGESEIKAQLKVISNRSWTAVFDEVDWAEAASCTHSNLSGIVDTSEITFHFQRNRSDKSRTSLLHIYSCGNLVADIPVEQQGVVFRLETYVASTDISEEGELVNVSVDSNSPWYVAIDPGSTASATLSVESGEDCGEVGVRFAENEEMTGKTLTLIFSTPNGLSRTIVFNQHAATRILKSVTPAVKLQVTGSSTSACPVLVPDLDVIGMEAVSDGVKLYFVASVEGFEELPVPTISDNVINPEGFDFLPDVLGPTDVMYMKVLAWADGYRKAYFKVRITNWRFTKNAMMSDYDGIVFSDEFATTKANYVQLATAANTITAAIPEAGRMSYYMKFHNASNKVTVTVENSSATLFRQEFTANTYKSDSPGTISGGSFEAVSDDALVIGFSRTSYLWDIALVEQVPFIP